MDITFISQEPEICRIFMDRLSAEGHCCFLEDDWLDFYLKLKNPETTPDLIVGDFRLMGDKASDVFEYVRCTGNIIPVLFYNDPIPDDCQRVEYWIDRNEKMFRSPFCLEMLPVLERINEIIVDPDVRKHISFLQPAVPLDNKKCGISTENREIDLTALRRRNRLPPVIFKLLKYMYANRHREMSVRELGKVLFSGKERFFVKENTIYSYISRLKKYIAGDVVTDMEIVRSGKGEYELVVY